MGVGLSHPLANRGCVHVSNMALPMTLRRLGVKAATVHGFRSTFSTWANELGIAKPDAIEAALAHREENAVRRAYNRSQFLAERRALMIAWDDFLAGRPVKRADGTAVKDAAALQVPAQHTGAARLGVGRALIRAAATSQCNPRLTREAMAGVSSAAPTRPVRTFKRASSLRADGSR